MRLRSWLAILACALVSSCATPRPVLSVPLHQQFSSLKVITLTPPTMAVRRRGIVTAGPSTALNAGLAAGLPAGLITAAVFGVRDALTLRSAKNLAQAHSAKFELAMAEFDFQEKINAVIRSRLETLPETALDYEVRYSDISKANLKDLLTSLKEDALLVLSSGVSMTPYLESLEVFTEFKLYRRPENQEHVYPDDLQPELTVVLKSQSEMIVPRINLPDASQIEKKRAEITAYHDAQLSKADGRDLSKYWKDWKKQRLQRLETNEMKLIAGDYEAIVGEELWLAQDAVLLIEALDKGILEQSNLLDIVLSAPASKVRDKDSQVGIPTIQTFPAGLFSSNETRVEKARVNGWLLSENERSRYYLTNYGVMVSIIKGDVLRPVPYIE